MSRRKKNRKRQRQRAMRKSGPAKDAFLAQMEAAFKEGQDDAVSRGKRGNGRKTTKQHSTTPAVTTMDKDYRDDPFWDPYGLEPKYDRNGGNVNEIPGYTKSVRQENGATITSFTPTKPEGSSGSSSPAGSSYTPPTNQTGNRPNVGYTGNYGKAKPVGEIMCVTKSGSLDGPYEVTSLYRDWWEVASKHYPPTDEGVMVIPSDKVKFSYGTVRFNACVFTATEDYLKARWGRTLHSTDRDWLAEHPLSTDDGVPQEYTAIAIQGLLEPYGLGVSRMRVRAGTLSAGDAIQQFMDALGCNPFAMVDRQTTNAEAAEKLGMDLETANALWRFEFHPDPLPCSIVGERGWVDSKGVQTGSFGGHARYLAPRSKGGNWFVSVQVAPVEQIDYLVPIALPEYKPRRGPATLMLGSVKAPDSDAYIAESYKGKYYAPEEVARIKAEEDAKVFSASTRVASTSSTPSTSSASSSSSSSSAPTTASAGTEQLSLEDQRWLEKHVPSVKSDEKPSERGFQTVHDVLSENTRALSPEVAVEEAEWGRSSLTSNDADSEEVDATYLTLERQNDARMAALYEDNIDGSLECVICHQPTDVWTLSRGTEICVDCYDAYWQQLYCPACKTTFKGSFTPWFLERDVVRGVTRFQCPNEKCCQEIMVDDEVHKTTHPQLVELAEACPDDDGEEFLSGLLDVLEQVALDQEAEDVDDWDLDDNRPADRDRWPSEELLPAPVDSFM